MSIEALLKSLKIIPNNYGDDNSDRLHYFLTTNLLIAASTITAWKVFEGRPMECMSPTSFPNSWATVGCGKFEHNTGNKVVIAIHSTSASHGLNA
uniref:Uncharacterized protein n=1 Tax=Setaria digitata TaxID=48799 RepID=A0A915PWE4_9BILA